MGFLDQLKKTLSGDEPPDEHDQAGHHHHHDAEREEKEEVSQDTYMAALRAQRAEKDSFFRMSPYSPLEPEDRQMTLEHRRIEQSRRGTVCRHAPDGVVFRHTKVRRCDAVAPLIVHY